jgi:hypothetical protein
MFSCRSHLKEFPGTLSRSPLPAGPTHPLNRVKDMGPPSVRRKRANIDHMRFAESLIPGSAIPSRLINPAGFDKIKPPAV